MFMKKVVVLLVFTLLTSMASVAFADARVSGHARREGTYVRPHYRSDANSTTSDNWSHLGNTNPYTGERGHRR